MMLQQATSHKVVVTGFCTTTSEEDQASLLLWKEDFRNVLTVGTTLSCTHG